MNVIWRPFSTKGESYYLEDATEVLTNCNLEVDSKQSPNCRTATRTRWRRSSGAYSCPSGEESRAHRARSGARTATAAPSTSSARARTAAATAPTSRAARFAVSCATLNLLLNCQFRSETLPNTFRFRMPCVRLQGSL